jgi:stage II sporulation protein D
MVTNADRSSHRSRLLPAAVLSTFVAAFLLTGPPGWSRAGAAQPVWPTRGVFTVSGAGYGHGIGMSQYGAYGAATLGKTWQQMMGFYYPGTTVTSRDPGRTIRVQITADNDNDLQVYPSAGLRLNDRASGRTYPLPVGAKYTRWRTVRTSTGYGLRYLNPSGTWVAITPPLSPTAIWTYENTAKMIKIRLPGGVRQELRSQVSLIRSGGGAITTNRLTMEDYLRSVVPSEMPTSWPAQAVQAQAVAARTFAARLQSQTGAGAFFDVCDTVACQVYRGFATTTAGIRTVHETAAGSAAVQATSGKILSHAGQIALTQFSSSNGGHSAPGSLPYLTAQPDPWDGVAKSQSWSVALTTAMVKQAYPTLGTIRQLQVLSRDGFGRFGGRVTSIKIIGSTGASTVTGPAFRFALGLRSALFTVSGSPNPAYGAFPRRYSSSAADLLAVRADTLVRYPVSSTGMVSLPRTLRTGFAPFTHVVNVGDWDGDGFQDVIARTPGERLLLFRGTASTALLAGVDLGLRSNHTEVTGIGDLNGDGRPDLVVLSVAGNLYVVHGNGALGYTGFAQLAAGWSDRHGFRSPGDMTGDGRPDLVTRQGSAVYLHPGAANSFGSPVRLDDSLAASADLASVGDFSGDGVADLLARDSSDQFVLYAGAGAGRLQPAQTLPTSLSGSRFTS